jgi:hypothetical protein
VSFNASGSQTIALGEGGNFDLEVYNSSSSSHSSAEYTLTATFVEGLSGVETEPNDSSSSADSLELGESVTGKLSDRYDEDRFEVSIPGPGMLTIDFTVPSGSTSKKWYVRALRNGSSSYGSVSFNASGSQTIALGEGGNFDLEVYNSSSSSHSSAEYTLTATFD